MKQRFILRSRDIRIRACEAVRDAPEGSEVLIKEATRSLDQNARMWAMITDVSKQRPQGRSHTPDVWKALFMHAAGYAVQFENGLETGSPFPVGFRSSRMSIREMKELMEFIEAWGAQNGVVFTEREWAA